VFFRKYTALCAAKFKKTKCAAHFFKLNRQIVGLFNAYLLKLVGDRRRNLQGFGGGYFFTSKRSAASFSQQRIICF